VLDKVLAYVVRTDQHEPELLLFEHAGDPAAGVQVPAGTVEPGEAVETALWRELLEESGLQPPQVSLVARLGDFPQPDWGTIRHVFLLEAAGGLPVAWRHTVSGGGEDQGMIFEYYWAALSGPPQLAGNQDRYLSMIESKITRARS
jgi:ADP-ribose pyrophosphatase YjhB (NUDIX family)